MEEKRPYISKTRKFQKRHYRKICYICTEGEKTEPEYFSMFKKNGLTVEIVPCNRKTNYDGIINKIDKILKYEKHFNITPEVWLVADIDNNKKEDFNKLQAWLIKNKCFSAISSPCFEYWLLLHFEEVKGRLNVNRCIKKLKKHVPNYNKGIDARRFYPNVFVAIKRAGEIESPNKDVPITERNGSTVYILVKRLIF
jgi:ribosomal protein S15P/S13E